MRKSKRNELRIRRLELMEIMNFLQRYDQKEYKKRREYLKPELKVICLKLKTELDYFPFTED